MPNCSAIICTNYSRNKMVLVSFHGFPAENNIETMMKMAVEYKRQNMLPSNSNFFISSDHFEEDCFERDLMVGINFA